MRWRELCPEWFRLAYRNLRANVLSLGLPRHPNFEQSDAELAASADISIIVCVHDSPLDVARCLLSLSRFGGQAEIIIVDDGSIQPETLSILDRVQREHGWIVLRHAQAVGHSRSCEDGARVATRPYLCLLNSDTVVTPYSWFAAKEAFEADPLIAVTGPSTSHAATRQMIWRAHYCRHHWTDEQIQAFARQYVEGQAPRRWMDLPEIGGFAFFIRRELWQEMNGFDPELKDYGNESELCIRLRKRGLRTVWTPNSYIHHIGSRTYGRERNLTINRRSQLAREYINRKHESTIISDDVASKESS